MEETVGEDEGGEKQTRMGRGVKGSTGLRSGEIIFRTRDMNSSAKTLRLNICFIRPAKVPIQESIISRFCFSFSNA